MTFDQDATLEAAAAYVSLANAITIDSFVSATFGAAAGDLLVLSGDVTADGGATLHFGSATNTGIVELALTATPSVTNTPATALAVDGGSLVLGSTFGEELIGDVGGLTVGTGAVSATLDLAAMTIFATNLTGDANGVIVNNGGGPSSLTTDNTQRTVFAGDIEDGAGTIALHVEGLNANTPLVLTGYNTYSGGTTIKIGAALQIGAGGTAGLITGDVVDNGTLDFFRSDNMFFGGAISWRWAAL